MKNKSIYLFAIIFVFSSLLACNNSNSKIKNLSQVTICTTFSKN